jgi:hypothetical protein
MTLSAHDLDSQTRLWCAGLPLGDTRDLNDLERGFLREAARRELLRTTLLAAAALAWLVAPFVLGVPSALNFEALPDGVALAALGWFAFLAVLVLWERDAFRDWRRRVRDLGSGELLIFEGDLAPEEGLRPEQRELARLGFLRRGFGEAQRLVVLAGSRQVWARNAKGRNLFASVWVHQVAALPEYGYRVPVPPEQLRVVSHPDLRFRKRVLSEAELRELRDYVGRLRRLDGGQWFAVVLLFLLAAEAMGAQGAPASGADLAERAVRDVLFVTVVILSWVRYWSRLKFADGLLRDSAIGWALSVDPECAASPVAPDSDADQENSPEFLAHSGALWIHQGKPAPWRVLRRAA